MNLDLPTLHGRWFVHYTNFPMWLKGDKTNPVITYSPTRHPQSMQDVVTYQKKGKVHTIRGTDHHITDRQFRWRGAGLLFFVTSDWQVDHHSEDRQWMIISFKKSLFTPPGNEILHRSPILDASLVENMLRTYHSLHPDQPLKRLDQTAEFAT